MRYIWENSVRNCAVCIANMPRFILKLWNHEELEKGKNGAAGGGNIEKEPLVLVQILFFAGLHCKAPQYNKPTNLLHGGPVEAEVFTGRIKKSTERSRLAKSLLWFKQGTRPVVMSHFASEAWGLRGDCWGGVCHRGMFSVFRLPSLFLGSLLWGLGGGKAGEGNIDLQGSILLPYELNHFVGFSDCLRLLFPIRIWEENQSNLLIGRKALQVYLV